MRVTVGRVTGVLALVWCGKLALQASLATEPLDAVLPGLMALLWFVAALDVLISNGRPATFLLMGVLCMLELLMLGRATSPAVAILFWYATIVGASIDHPDERRLLLRSFATVVYLSTALTKLNPAWLSGDVLRELVSNRRHLESLEFVLDWPATVLIVGAITILLTEAGIGVALWGGRTRRLAVATGVVLHPTLLVVAWTGTTGLPELFILNAGLIGLYPAFFDDDGYLTSASPMTVTGNGQSPLSS